MKSGIYQIRNSLNNKVYIGSAANLRNRKINHFSALQRGKHVNVHLQRAWNKYSHNYFKFEILEYTPLKCSSTINNAIGKIGTRGKILRRYLRVK